MVLYQSILIGVFFILQLYFKNDLITSAIFHYDGLILMLVISIIVGIPAGSVYSGSIAKILDNEISLRIHDGIYFRQELDTEEAENMELTEGERELAINWILIMMDLGSFLAMGISAYVLINYYPAIIINPPG